MSIFAIPSVPTKNWRPVKDIWPSRLEMDLYSYSLHVKRLPE